HAREALFVVSDKIIELGVAGRAGLRGRLPPLVTKILAAGGNSPLYLSGELVAARRNMGGDAGAVRRGFVASEQPQAVRLQALEALIAFRDPSLMDVLPSVMSSASPTFLAQVFNTLGRWDNPRLADVVLTQYPKLAPELQPLAVELLMQRLPWTRKLLNAVLE